MIVTSRRKMLAGSGLAALGGAVPGVGWAQAPAAGKADVFVGTGGHGHTFPGASLPFGMAQLSPDTDNSRWDACSGYHRTDGSIMGFSHTHLSGTGIGDMLDVLVVPTRGPLKLKPGKLGDADLGYRQRFSDEYAEPGYYRVRLESGVLSELTVTERCGIGRHRFPAGPGHILVDFTHMILDVWDKGVLLENASLAWGADGVLTGSRQVNRWAKGRHIHFAMQLSRKPDRIEFFGDDDKPAPKGASGVTGGKLKVALFFDDAGGEPILIKTGLSAVAQEGARAALAAEVPGWDFDGICAKARQTWANELQRVRVKGGTEAQRTILTSALYHAFLAPTLFTDRDGRYVGLDREVHQTTADSPAFSTYSLWDTYRALHPLMTLVQPERAEMFTRDLIRQTAESPYGPPVWPLQGVETGCMIGWHSVSVMAEAKVKGIEADYAAAWPNIRRRAFDPSFKDSDASLGREHYYQLGYIPADKVWESVSRTQEYAYDDWAMAVLAEAAGAAEDATALRARSRNYRNVLDASIGFARPKFSDGKWWEAYDPVQIGHMPKPWWRDYTEANGWQATFLNQHDVYGLIEHVGGDAAFEKKLDSFFNAPSTLPDNAPPDISGLVGQYAHGNEPTHHAAYLYAFAGAPWKTQAMVRRLLTEMYKDDPDGVIGNDDCGQMSAWFVFSALGFYPVDPVSALYVFGSPLFDEAEVSVGEGRTLRVRATGNAPGNPYVQSVRWNGKRWSRNWISHAELQKGGSLEFEMGPRPSRFGTAKADRPPSFGRTAAG
ncbi:GH92 family glycosyl hydrolase [Sphingomonas desiccabilis]|uniref:Alpha-mannosidase n=1 Tax=Sphingomonas desiccabilis TaxID=429134 RepID=A0A4V1QPW3_9SPHN|nr:GH92 family glycosyl hydrolase [Sphingomonas desiccabilis]MBB3910561.1 putative alpha-1,2-mannosidase [Sphingomonas desiccabilis]RXZ35197.1 alpha-mannosidase [Sphingomonas desiccabilis]